MTFPIESGLDFVSLHLENPVFPRRIATYATGGKQVLVKNKEEALARFKQSNLLDCKISAYPFPVPEYKGFNRQAPDLFLSDVDRKNSKSNESFKQSLRVTLRNFKNKLHGATPNVLWSGGGYHFIQPLDADIVLEMESVFSEFAEPSRKLMQYAERLVTDNKADPCHSNTVSFNNCMIRIPCSYNSKYGQFNGDNKVVNIPPISEVRIVQRWDGYRPNIRWLLKDYWIYLIQERNDEILNSLRLERRRMRSENNYYTNYGIIGTGHIGTIDWIESLYRKPLDDFRKYCTWRILIPYFINIKKLSRSDTFNLLMSWLNRCSTECRRLDFDPRRKIEDLLNGVRKYRPISKDRLKIENEALYLRLKSEYILS